MVSQKSRPLHNDTANMMLVAQWCFKINANLLTMTLPIPTQAGEDDMARVNRRRAAARRQLL